MVGCHCEARSGRASARLFLAVPILKMLLRARYVGRVGTKRHTAQPRALLATVNGVPHVAPGLLAWLDHVADWESDRRRGVDFPLQPPDEAVPPDEDVVSLDAAMMLRQRFAEADRVEARGMSALLDAVVSLLGGGGLRH